MKKIILFLLIGSVLIAILPSCEQSPDVYTVLINEESRNYKNINVSAYGTFSMSEQTYQKSSIATNKTEKIMDMDFVLKYDHSTKSSINSGNLDYYIDNTKKCQVVFSSNTGKLSKIMSNDDNTAIFSYQKKIVEAEYISWVKNIVSNVFSIDLTRYDLICRTSIKNGDVGSRYDKFVIQSENDSEAIGYYCFEFVQYNGNIRIGDMIRVISNLDGSIDILVRFESGINDLSSITIDEDKLNRTIANTIDNIGVRGYSIDRYEIQGRYLEIYEGNPIVRCGVNVISKDDNGEEISCAIMIAIEINND